MYTSNRAITHTAGRFNNNCMYNDLEGFISHVSSHISSPDVLAWMDVYDSEEGREMSRIRASESRIQREGLHVSQHPKHRAVSRTLNCCVTLKAR